jgi:hypothetical protein
MGEFLLKTHKEAEAVNPSGLAFPASTSCFRAVALSLFTPATASGTAWPARQYLTLYDLKIHVNAHSNTPAKPENQSYLTGEQSV